MNLYTTKIVLLVTYCFLSTSALHGATVNPILSQLLEDVPGREVKMITVEYEPGGATPVHRHDAHTFVFVLEGAIEMQVKGGPLTTVNTGEVFYESPDDVHSVSKNASVTKHAKFLVFFIKHKNKASTLPVDGR